MDANPTFILFQLARPEQAEQKLPVAALVRIDAALGARLAGGLRSVMDDGYRSLDIALGPDDVRWLSVVAFRSDNTLAPVPDWFDPDSDALVYASESNNMELEDGVVEYSDCCVVYSAESIPSAGVELEKYAGRVLVSVSGETTSHWNVHSLSESWANLSPQLPGLGQRKEGADVHAGGPRVVAVVLGELACRALEDGRYGELEQESSLVTHEFATKAEADAFVKGLNEGAGWMEVNVLDDDDVAKIASARHAEAHRQRG